MIRFHDSWLEDPALRDWVVKVSNDESRAYCRWCQIVLRAHKADLTTHSNTAKHAKNTESANLNGVASGPIYVQIVPSDDQNSPVQPPNNNNNNQLALPNMSYSSELVKPSSYSKRFRPEWQELEELKDWLEPAEDVRKAYCKMCDVQLRAHRHDLILHGRSTKHKRSSSQGLPPITNSSSTSTSSTSIVLSGEIENGELVDTKLPPNEYNTAILQHMVGDDDDDDLPIKKCRMELTEPSNDGIHAHQHHHHHHNILSNESDQQQQQQHHHHHLQQEHILPGETHSLHDNNNDDDDEEHGDGEEERDPIEIDKPATQINVIRIIDTKKSNQSIYHSQNTLRIGNTPQNTQIDPNVSRLRGRRPRMTAADVIRAIDMNEFTGYEMLQILKRIAPKL